MDKVQLRTLCLFFKTLKQNLKVKSFVGTSENALRIQIWTALLALLLLKWLHHLSKAKWSLSNLASMLRLNLFTYRDLRNWCKTGNYLRMTGCYLRMAELSL